KPIGLLTFLSGNCTLEDDQSVQIKPFGVCPMARAMIRRINRTGPTRGAENVWVRTTPAQGEIMFARPQDAAELTIDGNSAVFREAGPAGEGYSNTVTWTTPPERMTDEPWIDKPTMFPQSVNDCTYKGEVSATGNEGAQIGFFAHYKGPVAGIGDSLPTSDGWPSSHDGNVPRRATSRTTMGFRFASPTKFKPGSGPRFANGP